MRRLFTVMVIILALAVSGLPGAAVPQEQGSQTDTIRSDVNLISVYFTVRDGKKRLASELEQSQFHVFEDGREQPIKFFAHHSDVVLNVGMLLDTGTNMAWILGQEADASSAFLQRVVRPTDLGFVVSYHARVDTLQVPTSDTALLQKKVDDIRHYGSGIGTPNQASRLPLPLPGGGGPQPGPTGQPYNVRREAHLYDAVRVSTLRYLANEIGRKAVVIVALSGDSKSESTLEDALEVLLQNDVIAYVLQIFDRPHPVDRCDVVHTYERDSDGEYKLKKMAEATGGRMLEVHGIDKIESALDEISEELHHQYSLGYYPENTNWDGKFRKIQIAAQEHGYKVFARKGYYAQSRAR